MCGLELDRVGALARPAKGVDAEALDVQDERPRQPLEARAHSALAGLAALARLTGKR